MCIPDEELIITSPIPREFEVTSTGKRKAPNGLVDKEIKVLSNLLGANTKSVVQERSM